VPRTGQVLALGVHRRDGFAIRVYGAAKHRNKVGIDVAVEALRDYGRRHRGGASDLARFARICRVTRVMQPYLDAIAGLALTTGAVA
jgi:hypothetical protein